MARIKRLEVPGFWPIEKKTKKYTVATMPGPHSMKNSLTIAVVIRDVLKHAETLKEVREILNTGTVKVDGITRSKPGFPAGLMDVVTIGEENYRLLPGKHGLYLKAVDSKESVFTLKKITNKTTIKKGLTQLSFHDGSTLVTDGRYNTGDAAVFDIKSRKVKDVIKQEKGATIIVTKGNNMGAVGTLEEIKTVKSPEPNVATILADGRKITLPLDYVFPVGRPTPVISLGEEDEQ